MKPVVSSVRVRTGERHDVVTVWSRGGNAGELIVDKGDGDEIADRLCGDETPRAVARANGDETVFTPLPAVKREEGDNPFQPGHPIWCARKYLYELAECGDPWPAGCHGSERDEWRLIGSRALRAALDFWAGEAPIAAIEAVRR